MRLPFSSKQVFWLKRRTPAQVIDEVQQVVAANPTNTDMLVILGVAFYETKNYEKAITLLQENVRLLSQQSQTSTSLNLSMIASSQYWLGRAFADVDRMEEAHAAWSSSLEAYERLIPDARSRRRNCEVREMRKLLGDNK